MSGRSLQPRSGLEDRESKRRVVRAVAERRHGQRGGAGGAGPGDGRSRIVGGGGEWAGAGRGQRGGGRHRRVLRKAGASGDRTSASPDRSGGAFATGGGDTGPVRRVPERGPEGEAGQEVHLQRQREVGGGGGGAGREILAEAVARVCQVRRWSEG